MVPSSLQAAGPDAVVVGPVIGTVTSRKARILIEVAVTRPVTMVLTSGDHVTKQTEYCVKGIPSLFKFSSLRPEARYQVRVEGFKSVKSSFRCVNTKCAMCT